MGVVVERGLVGLDRLDLVYKCGRSLRLWGGRSTHRLSPACWCRPHQPQPRLYVHQDPQDGDGPDAACEWGWRTIRVDRRHHRVLGRTRPDTSEAAVAVEVHVVPGSTFFWRSPRP